ncbi:uncharacterized protein [Rutidosis leptorrhynchoides]|uniref:uncharacterized protein n=1 Tax=Rutidosis leptorrhynchoides TaxID=125765 RepID=UPI003A99BEB0
MTNDDDDVVSSSVTLINKLDFGDPLYLLSDTNGTFSITIKLKGTENYNVWSRVMILALNTKSKKGFIDGTCKRKDYEDNDVLVGPWDRCNFVVLTWILTSFLMGLIDIYQPIRSNILTRDPLPSVKIQPDVSANAGNIGKRVSKGLNPNFKCTKCGMIGHTIDRCFEVIDYPHGYKRKPFNQGAPKFNASNNNTCSANYVPSSSQFTDEQFQKIMSLINDKNYCTSVNMAGIDGLSDSVDVSKLGIFVTHLNGTQAKIHLLGDFKLNDEIVLKNVLHIPEYTDLTINKTVGIDDECSGLYLFKLGNSLLKNNMINANVSINVWHKRLGHPASQVLNLLKPTFGVKGLSNDNPCYICHKAEQTREPFPLSDYKTTSLGDIVHVDL